jgi:hypothetical protein
VERWRQQITEAATAVLGSGVPVTIPYNVAKIDAVRRVIDEYLAEWRQQGMLMVDPTDAGSLVTRSSEWKGITRSSTLAR